MATTNNADGGRLGELRAKAALFNELVEDLARAEDELERLRAEPRVDEGIDPAWREIANDLASALRPYSCFREQKVHDGRIVVETRVPGATLSRARAALDRLADQVRRESHRAAGMVPDWREHERRSDESARRAA